jgi:hypothetical protein
MRQVFILHIAPIIYTTYSDFYVACVGVKSDLEFHVLDNRRVDFHPVLFQRTQAVLRHWYASLLRVSFLFGAQRGYFKLFRNASRSTLI